MKSVLFLRVALGLALVSQFGFYGHARAAASGVDNSDPIATLNHRLETGQDKLEYEANGLGFLKSLLAHLGVDPNSQILVFSKTSLQHTLIGPETPRAIYFNDQVAIGSVQNAAVLELMAPTREGGYAFYTMENQDPRTPRFTRHQGATCGRCHGSDSIEPGLIVASTPTHADGNAALIFGEGPARLFNFTDQTTPLSDRWGGWYVTGTHGNQPHLGNGAFVFDDDGTKHAHQANALNVLDLSPFFNLGPYLRPSSDIAALMTFEHQARMTNMLLRAGALARNSRELARDEIEKVVSHMLFAGEAPLTAPVKGNTSFAETFMRAGPRDASGRSLRDFDLTRRLFKYPLSYMIYSPTFTALPASIRRQILGRIVEILESSDSVAPYAHLSVADRSAILAILRDTTPGAELGR